jgi:hypothetical protein
MDRTILGGLLAIAVQPILFVLWIATPMLLHGETVPWGEISAFSAFAAVVAVPFVIVVGLPTTYFLHKRGRFSWRNLALIGFLAPAIPMAFFLPGSEYGSSYGGSFHGQIVEFVVNGKATIYGWLSYLEAVLTFGVHGLVGASVFYLVCRKDTWSQADPP